jgi:hypothetical protein
LDTAQQVYEQTGAQLDAVTDEWKKALRHAEQAMLHEDAVTVEEARARTKVDAYAGSGTMKFNNIVLGIRSQDFSYSCLC